MPWTPVFRMVKSRQGATLRGMSVTEENILVVPRAVFERLGLFEGLSFNVERYMPTFLDPNHNLFMSRGAAEKDPTHKQLIPYLVIRHDDRVLHYTRGNAGGEARLHAKGSIGIGGHINDGDSGNKHFDPGAYHRAVERELHEELEIHGTYHQVIAALLNDDSTEVGRVHLGVVHVVTVESPEIKAREDAIRNVEFLSVGQLAARRDHLETWSQIVFDGIDRLLRS